MEENEEVIKQFDYCDKVDLHALNPNSNLKSVVSIASEHGFRGIVVPLGQIDQLVKDIKEYGSKELLPICAIDYPYGSLSLDARNYCLMSAKEKGAREIEIVAPYHFIADFNSKKLQEDAQALIGTAKKANIGMKYVLDQNGPYMDDKVRSNISRMLQFTRMPIVSTSLGFFDNKSDHSDNIIKMRTMKSKSGCNMKVFITSQDVNDIASYVKAGADIIGLQWNKAAQLVHAYEEMVQKKD